MHYVFECVMLAEGCKTYTKKSFAAREKETSPVQRKKLVRLLKQQVS